MSQLEGDEIGTMICSHKDWRSVFGDDKCARDALPKTRFERAVIVCNDSGAFVCV